jgi:NADPH:quinone reductase-like Zn-dependent oxidoreductase
MSENITLEVDRASCGETRLVEAPLEPLADGAVRLRVDRFALTANNVTYAVLGDMLGYWDFFPTGDPAWGRVPAMGWADVVESAHPEVATGGRYYGWFPMARFVDLTVSPTSDGLRDDGEHRLAHAPVYRSYVETGHDPMYPSVEPDRLGDAEDRHALLRGLFLTSFLADCFFADQGYFGTDAVVVLSASSKTAVGFAQRASERGIGHVVGVTSAGNAEFVRSLGWYTDVVTYDDVAALPAVDAVSVDMAGDSVALAAVHEQLGDRLKYSMIIGKSHHDSPMAQVSVGPTPELFFAPTEVSRRLEEWGPEEYQRRCSAALEEFVAGSGSWLTVERSAGASAAASAWTDVFAGAVPPSIGRIVSLHD